MRQLLTRLEGSGQSRLDRLEHEMRSHIAGVSYANIHYARLRDDGDALTESSLNRLWSHARKAEGGGRTMGIVTAFRGAYSSNKNRQRNSQLIQQVRSAGLSATRIKGIFAERKKDGTLGEPEEEWSYVVFGATKEQMIKWRDRWDQDSVIYVDPAKGGHAWILDKKEGEHDLGKFAPGKIAQHYSKIKGGTFVFEGVMEGSGDCNIAGIINREIRELATQGDVSGRFPIPGLWRE